ncbi:MAG: HAMP domain-containing histidine kinase [Deltaproteobacteria bacterium]|nr:HAMP domain-containing histidine kinase [Deltaproteobacteria bacterium]
MSIRARILIAIVAPALALLVASAALVTWRVHAARVADLDAALHARAAALAAVVERDDQGVWETEPLEPLAAGLAFWDVRVHPDGPRIGASGVLPTLGADGAAPVTFPLPWPDARPALVSERVANQGGARVLRAVHLVRAEEPGGDDDGRGASRDGGTSEPPFVGVTVAADLAPIERDLRALVFAFGLAGALFGALALVVGALLSRRIVDPLTRMAAAAEAVRTPTATPPLERSNSGDEIDRLAATVNDAFARVYQSWESQRRFAADASHELRTPIAVVRSQAEVMLRAPRTPEEYREALAHVGGAAARMQRTVEGLLLLARADRSAQREALPEVDVAEVAREAIAAAPRRQGVAVDGRGLLDGAMVRGNADQLRILVTNLIENAVRHARASVQVHVDRKGAQVELVVADDGAGIPAEALPRIFERFFRVDAARSAEHGGAGLGLSIVQTIAELHGGRARAESTLGVGTSLIIEIPSASLQMRPLR